MDTCVSSGTYLKGMIVGSLLSNDKHLIPNIDKVMVVTVIYTIRPPPLPHPPTHTLSLYIFYFVLIIGSVVNSGHNHD